jgi:hypothetical protein
MEIAPEDSRNAMLSEIKPTLASIEAAKSLTLSIFRPGSKDRKYSANLWLMS